jgi:hypothetical protein
MANKKPLVLNDGKPAGIIDTDILFIPSSCITDGTNIINLSDVDADSLCGCDPTDFAAASHNHAWVDVSKTGSVLDDLGNVDTTGQVSGCILSYNGTNWVPVTNPNSVWGISGGYICTSCSVGIGTSAPETVLHVVSSGLISSTNDNATLDIRGGNVAYKRGILNLSSNSTSASEVGRVEFIGRDASNNEEVYGTIYSNQTVTTDGSETGSMTFRVRKAGQTIANSVVATMLGSGNVGIGTTAPGDNLTITKSNDWAIAGIRGYSTSTATKFPVLMMSKSLSNTIGTLAQTTDGTALGNIQFLGATATPAEQYGAEIIAVQDGVTGTYVPTNLVLSTYSATAANANQLVLHNDGFVGIGTSSPVYSLDVVGDGLRSTAPAAGNYAVMARSGSNEYVSLGSGTTGKPTIQGINSTISGTADLIVQPLGGNVGIGTAAPEGTLHVDAGNVHLATIEIIAAAQQLKISEHNTGAGGIVLQTQTRAEAGIANVSGRTLAINPNGGNVGIGTDSPTNNLEIVGAADILGTTQATQIYITSTDAYNANPASGIVQKFIYTSGGSYTTGSGISFLKENAVDGEYGTAIALATRTHGAGAMAERVRIDSDGNVGIGTENPTKKLEVVDTSAGSTTTPLLLTNVGGSTDDTGVQLAYNLFDTANTYTTAALKSYRAGSANYPFQIRVTDNDGVLQTRMHFTNYGNVGIGTSTPGVNLEVNGAIKATATGGIAFGDAGTASSYVGAWRGTSTGTTGGNVLLLSGYDGVGITTGAAVFGAQGPPDLYVDNIGKVGIGTSTPRTGYILETIGASLSSGVTGGNYFEDRDSETKLIWGWYSSGNVAKFTNSTAWSTFMSVDSVGKVGIGTATPAAKLDINDAPSVNYGHILLRDGASAWTSVFVDATNHDLHMSTATGGWVRRLTVSQGGNVGVNTSSPAATLDVCGIVGSAATALKVTSDANADDKVFHFIGNTSVACQQMVMLQDGKVGVGITNPSRQFVVSNGGNAGIEISPASIYPIISYDRFTSAYIPMNLAGSQFAFSRNESTVDLAVNSSGNTSVGTTCSYGSLTVYGTSMAMYNQCTSAGSAQCIDFIMRDSGSVDQTYGQISACIMNNTAGAEHGAVRILSLCCGAMDTTMTVRKGCVGIGTTAPAYKFEVLENIAAYMAIMCNSNTSGYGLYVKAGSIDSATSTLALYNTNGCNTMAVKSDGSFCVPFMGVEPTTSGTPVHWYSGGALKRFTSSCRYKTCIEDANLDLSNYSCINPRSYYGCVNDCISEQQSVGLIAEELNCYYPQFVVCDDQCQAETVSYQMLSVLNIAKIKEMMACISCLEQRLSALEG